MTEPTPRALAALLFAAALLLYANTIPNGYGIDDESVTRGHHATSRGLAALPEIFTTPHMKFAGQEFEYRPLPLATFALEHEIVGEDPHVGHGINVLLYAITAVVLFRYFLALLGAQAASFCFVSALLFVAHPLHTEVVASLKNREEILALLFGLTSTLLFLRAFDRGRRRDAAAGVAAFVLALMCKVSAAPFALFIPSSLAFRDSAQIRRAAWLGVALIACSLVYVRIVLTFVPAFTPAASFVENPLVGQTDLSVRVGAALSSLLFYLEKLLVPYPLRFYYGYDTIPLAGALSIRAAVSFAAYAALALYALRNVRARNAAAFGIAWYLIAIAPYSNLGALAKGIVAERSAYLASVGFALALAFAVFRLAGIDPRATDWHGKGSRAVIACVAVIVAAYAALTLERNRAWADTFTLYETDLPGLPRSVMAHQIYARQLRREFGSAPASAERTQKLERAIELSKQALATLPAYAEADEHIGAIYLYDLARPEDAFPYLSRASDLEPRYVQAHYDALYCSVLLGRLDAAVQFGERLLHEDPDHVMGLFYMSKLHFRAGEVEKAFAENARLAELAPDRDLAYVNYGYFYYERSDVPRAIENFEKALAIAPDNPAVRKDLVAILEERGETEEARRYSAP